MANNAKIANKAKMYPVPRLERDSDSLRLEPFEKSQPSIPRAENIEVPPFELRKDFSRVGYLPIDIGLDRYNPASITVGSPQPIDPE